MASIKSCLRDSKSYFRDNTSRLDNIDKIVIIAKYLVEIDILTSAIDHDRFVAIGCVLIKILLEKN